MKGSRHWNYQHGLFSGFSEYRYSAPLARKHKPIFKGEKRDHIVSRAMDALRDWRFSPFEHEGSVRAGVRSGLCLQGYDWHRSDAEAEAIVTRALSLLGAQRPTWEQGQPEYLEPRENCRGCGTPLDEEQIASRLPFCSVQCARAARQRWGFDQRRREDDRYNEVTEAILKLAAPTRKCPQCSKKFRSHKVRSGGVEQVYCSLECTHESKRTIDERSCLECGVSFRPDNNKNAGRYCSHACAYAGKGKREVPRTCVCCGTEFIAATKGALYCSSACTSVYSRFRTGNNPPKQITPSVLDYLLHKQGLRITTDRMAA